MSKHKRKDWIRRETKRPTETLVLKVLPQVPPGMHIDQVVEKVSAARKTVRRILENLMAEGAIIKVGISGSNVTYYRQEMKGY